MTQERFSKLTVLNTATKREQPNPHTHTSKEVVAGPRTFTNAPQAVLHAAAVVWS